MAALPWLACSTPSAWLACSPRFRASTLLLSSISDPMQERRLLRGVLYEAAEKQRRKRFSLEEQSRSAELALPDDEGKGATKARARAQSIPRLIAEVDAAEQRLDELKGRLSSRHADLIELRRAMEQLGLGPRLQTFDVNAHAFAQWGRPEGFDGLVLVSPRGVPILVGKQTFSDSLLRRVARGVDLWFQVREGRGSRVLLRTSMCRMLTRSQRECMEMAADVAAYFSDQGHCEDVQIMYTDSRRVAKRGGRVGQMKDSKKLGFVSARPARVANAVREAQEEQGFPVDRNR